MPAVLVKHSNKIILGLLLFSVLVYSLNSIGQVDTFYHVKTGEYIWQNKTVPTQDIFSLTALGNEWVPHEWLGQVIFYFVWRFGGAAGLIVFPALLAILAYCLLHKTARLRGADSGTASVLLFALGYLTLELWTPRPQIFGYLALAALLYLLEKYRQQLQKKCLAIAVGTIWLWANFHASFILGLAILFWYFLSERIFGNDQRAANWIGATAVAATAVAFMNPAGYKAFLYAYYIRGTAAVLNVTEWQPITAFLDGNLAKIFLGIFAVINVFLVFRFWRTKNMTALGLLLGISVLPFISIRHVGFWPLIAAPLFAAAASATIAKIREKFGAGKIAAAAGAVFTLFLVGRYFSLPRQWLNKQFAPVEAVNFIQSADLRGPYFNLYNEGGYLIWRLWPQDQVFIDGRSEVYGEKELRDFFTIVHAQPGWENLADEKYGLNYFLLTYQPLSLAKTTGPLTEKLLQKNFVLVYWDDLRVILARNNQQNAGIVQKYGVKYVSPFRDPAQIPAADRKAAAAEIQSLLERQPDSQSIRLYAAKLLSAPSAATVP